MILVEQRGGSDCLRAALATILNLSYEEVDAAVCDQENQHNKMQMFLRSRGLIAWTFSIHGEDVPKLMFGNDKIEYHLFPTGYWLASVLSPRNEDGHVVVMKGTRIFYDPHPQREQGHRGFEQAIILMPWNDDE